MAQRTFSDCLLVEAKCLLVKPRFILQTLIFNSMETDLFSTKPYEITFSLKRLP